ncbi:MAG: hypothetical protein KGJ05_06950, partial [Alphaproteobacteria bacterium]|nr:hypothetical protein [Alphaproteobacteria bacterium]
MPDTSHFHDSYSLGRVFSRAFELLKNNLAGVGVFMLILHLLMGLATYISTEASRNIMAMTLANPPPANPAANLQHLSAMLAAFEAPQYWLSPIAVFV